MSIGIKHKSYRCVGVEGKRGAINKVKTTRLCTELSNVRQVLDSHQLHTVHFGLDYIYRFKPRPILSRNSDQKCPPPGHQLRQGNLIGNSMHCLHNPDRFCQKLQTDRFRLLDQVLKILNKLYILFPSQKHRQKSPFKSVYSQTIIRANFPLIKDSGHSQNTRKQIYQIFFLSNLWCYVVRCATEGGCFILFACFLSAHPEIGDFGVTVAVQKNVVQLQVAIHDT